MPAKGLFVVIDGVDSTGKATQFGALRKRLEKTGYEVLGLQFPRYDEPSSYFVREYLQGKYGTADDVSPYTASLFYAMDRYQASLEIQKALDGGKVVLCDRFTPSNMIHQGTKFTREEQRRGYFLWLDNIEHEVLGIPRPDVTFILQLPAGIIERRLSEKERSSTHVKKDIHEANAEHMRKAIAVSGDICIMFPKDFTPIQCAPDGELLSIKEVGDEIWEKVAPMLPQTMPRIARSAGTPASPPPSLTTDNPYIEHKGSELAITDAGHEFLAGVITDTRGSVYAFNNKLSAVTIAAAMARLSRRADDMRVTILDEFAAKLGKDEQLLKRVITAYGDDSVQQLAGVHLVVEKATKLLTNKLEWGRLAAYLEKSTRYIYFDRRDERGRYKFHIPEQFDKRTKIRYIDAMHDIFTHYSSIVRELTDYISQRSATPEGERDGAWKAAVRAQACDAARAALPTSTETTVGIYASGQALEGMIMHLLSDELPEARVVGQAILNEARKVLPVFLERADKPDRGGATIAYRANTRQAVKRLAERYLPNNHSSAGQTATLNNYWPRNELTLVADMLYEFSNQPLEEIQTLVDGWPYERKLEVFQTYMGERLNRRHRPGRALEKIHYSWDIVSDFGTFCDLQRHRMVDDLEWQPMSTQYGFDIPPLVEEAGLSEPFVHCFEVSARLYDELLRAGYAVEAQYATLLGHRMRWKVTYNARQAFHFHELRTSPQGHPAYRQLVLSMYRQMAEAHPLLASHMLFVNKDEDPELSRLAAERYSQYKLSLLEVKPAPASS